MSDAIGIFEFLYQSPGVLWNDWPTDMTPRLLVSSDVQFSLSGTCPHCMKPSVFMMVTSPHIEPSLGAHKVTIWAVMQCQGCGKYICGSITKPSRTDANCAYNLHYPVGKPSDDAPPEIPENIRDDFREAMRCRFVDAHNATVEMCRRAVQGACIHLNAPADQKLVRQIDWLATQGIITTPLKDMAHRIRLGGNAGAHPPEDPNDPEAITVGSDYADAVIEFTREFFQHVYVMPARLKKFNFRPTHP